MGVLLQVAYGPKMFLEEQDVVLLSEGEEVTLLDWGNAFVKTIEKDEAGKPKHVTMTLHLEGDFKTTKQKLSWVADVPVVPSSCQRALEPLETRPEGGQVSVKSLGSSRTPSEKCPVEKIFLICQPLLSALQPVYGQAPFQLLKTAFGTTSETLLERLRPESPTLKKMTPSQKQYSLGP